MSRLRGEHVGMDEAGRGSLIGPMVVAAVMAGGNLSAIADAIRDSKKLRPNKRRELAALIGFYAKAVGMGEVSAREIEQHGYERALELAYSRAFANLMTAAPKANITSITIDGLRNYLPDNSLVTNQIGADGVDLETAAASILATARFDELKQQFEANYPGYGFGTNGGYSKAEHLHGLTAQGPCPEHRMNTRPVRTAAALAREGVAQGNLWEPQHEE